MAEMFSELLRMEDLLGGVRQNSALLYTNGKLCLQNLKIVLAKQFETVINFQPSLENPHVSG